MQGELRTKRTKVPHAKLLCSPLFISFWTLPSSETAAGFSTSHQTLSPQKKVKALGFFQQHKGVFPAYQSSWLSRLGGGSESLWRLQRVFCHLTNRTADLPCREVHASTSRNWPGAAPPHYIAETGYVPVPDSFKFAAFSWGGWRQCRCAALPSAVRMSISAALEQHFSSL